MDGVLLRACPPVPEIPLEGVGRGPIRGRAGEVDVQRRDAPFRLGGDREAGRGIDRDVLLVPDDDRTGRVGHGEGGRKDARDVVDVCGVLQ